jgi:hypothetical protein
MAPYYPKVHMAALVVPVLVRRKFTYLPDMSQFMVAFVRAVRPVNQKTLRLWSFL